jgi:hypothetical protein
VAKLLHLGAAVEGDFHPAGEEQLGVSADLGAGIPPGNKIVRRRGAHFRLFAVQPERLGALEAPHVEGFA